MPRTDKSARGLYKLVAIKILAAMLLMGYLCRQAMATEGVLDAATGKANGWNFYNAELVRSNDKDAWITADNVKDMLLFEGVVIADAFLASNNPKAFGSIVMIFCPMAAGTPKSSNTSIAVNLLAIEAWGLYNVRIDRNHTPKRDIFKANFIGMHMLGVIILTGSYLFDREIDQPARTSFDYIPQAGGGTLMFSYRF